MTNFLVGDFVVDKFFGRGVVTRVIRGMSQKVYGYIVHFEKEPPTGINPCIRWLKDLEC